MASKNPVFVAAVSSKGGTGKTTTSAAIAHALAEAGDRVICVDLDPQSDLTVHFGYDPQSLEVERTVAAVIAAGLDGTPGEPSVADLAVPLPGYERLRLLPASPDLARVVKLVEADNWGLTAVREALRSRAETFECDWVVMDTPPTLSTYVLALLVASDRLLIPVNPDLRAFRGAERIVAEVGRIRSRNLQPDLEVAGAFIAGADSVTNLSKEAEAALAEYTDWEVLPAVPRTVRISEAASAGQPITRFAPNHPAAEAYRQIAAHLRSGRKARDRGRVA